MRIVRATIVGTNALSAGTALASHIGATTPLEVAEIYQERRDVLREERDLRDTRGELRDAQRDLRQADTPREYR